MGKARGLHTLQRLAEYGADAASREVGEKLRALRAEEERLRQVQGYLGHYDELLKNPAGPLAAGAMQGRRSFVARLRDATDRQQDVVAGAERSYRAQLEHWRDARAKALALQHFNERARMRAGERRERREQVRLDEIGMRRR